MIDADVTPFDPAQWTVEWNPSDLITRADALIFDKRISRLTSVHGTQLLVNPGFLMTPYMPPPPIWWVKNIDNQMLGWFSQASSDDPLQDLHRAALQSDALDRKILALERWALEQGLQGGPWTYESTISGLWDGTHQHRVPDTFHRLLASMVPMTRFSKMDDEWYVLSGADAAHFTLPTTRHAALARLSVLKPLEAPKS